MVEAARKHNSADILYAIGESHYPPLRDDSVDLVIKLNGIDREHSPRMAAERMKSFLRDGATVVIGNCMPLQTRTTIGGIPFEYVTPEDALNSPMDALQLLGDIEIVYEQEDIEWHPNTVIDGEENLRVSVVVGKVRKADSYMG